MKIKISLLVLVLSVFCGYGAQFDLGTNGFLSFTIPKGWDVRGRAERRPDGTEKGYIISLQPTNKVNAKCLLSLGYVTSNAPDKTTLRKQLSEMCEPMVSKSVEKQKKLKDFSLQTGHGSYCVFTDVSLVGKEVPKGEFRVMGVGLIQLGNDILGTASMMADDGESKEFKDMVEMIESLSLTPKFSK